jgi:hypothetical protein
MKHVSRLVLILALIGIIMVPVKAMALDPLADFLISVDKQARTDLVRFNKEISSTFGIPVPDVEKLLNILPSPGDVFMALRVGEVAHVPVDRVVTEYKAHKGQGWGVIAKNLGIKPGSAEFHALKEGRLPSQKAGKASHGGGPGKGPNGKGGGKHGKGKK